MKIVICGSVDITPKIKEVYDTLTKMGHEVDIPTYSKKIIEGTISLEEYLRVKQKEGDLKFRQAAEEDLIKKYYRLIKEADSVLILNVNKNGIENYIGGNSFLEIGFAHILGKKIFLFNPVPKMNYRDEIVAMNPFILNGDLSKIK